MRVALTKFEGIFSRMERNGRRNRRGRCHSQCLIHQCPPERSVVSNCISSLQTYVVTASMIILIYIMMEYHCKNCTSNCDLERISKSIEEIAVNLSKINGNYQALEKKVLMFSQELPKMEGQIEILEALANSIECRRYEWNPKTNFALPNLDMYLQPFHKIEKQSQKNCTNTKPVQAS